MNSQSFQQRFKNQMSIVQWIEDYSLEFKEQERTFKAKTINSRPNIQLIRGDY